MLNIGICSINFLKSTSIHGKFINEAVEIDMAF